MNKTPRLTYSIIGMEDAADVFETLNDQHTAEIIRFFDWPMTLAQAQGWCRKAVQGHADQSEYMFIARQDGKPVGCVGVHLESGPDKAETGYWVSPAFQKQGMATEMLGGAIEFAFETLGVGELIGITSQDNPASEKVLTKNGFEYKGDKDIPLPDGGIRHSKIFILRNPEA